MTRRIPNVLSIAGTDPSGGAGLMADLKTFGALGAYGCSVVTAVVAQNTHGVAAVTQMTADQVRVQLENLLEDVQLDALKIGMLGSAEVIEVVAQILRDHPALTHTARVLDPVMVASSGDRLIDDDAVGALRTQLVPIVDLITPNLAEAGVLLERPAPTAADEETARALLDLGSGVLLKGGHGEGSSCDDLFVMGEETARFSAPRVETTSTHGTGCTLSAALTALRPQRETWAATVADAKEYLTAALTAADQLDVGRPGGHGPVNHFHAWW